MVGVLNDAVTKPTLETVLERINALRDDLSSQIATIRDAVESLREEVEIRLDRIEGMTNQTRAEMLTLRADFREYRAANTKSLD